MKMAVNEIIQLPSLGAISQSMDWAQTINWVLWLLLIALVVGVSIRWATHRRLVRIYERVKDGYVVHTKRYRVSYDKEHKLEYLNPIFGKDRLPNFSSKYWQHTKTTPIFGVNRVLSIIKQNPNTYRVMTPPDDDIIGQLHDESASSWVYFDQFRIFKESLKKDKFIYFLSIAAPLAIIIGAIGFWIFAMFSEGHKLHLEANQINIATEQLRGACEAWIQKNS